MLCIFWSDNRPYKMHSAYVKIICEAIIDGPKMIYIRILNLKNRGHFRA